MAYDESGRLLHPVYVMKILHDLFETNCLSRFLVVVLAAYRQMHAQNHPVLSDVEEKDFDRAFEHFRPSKSIMLRMSSNTNQGRVQSFRDIVMLPLRNTPKPSGKPSISVPKHSSLQNLSLRLLHLANCHLPLLPLPE